MKLLKKAIPILTHSDFQYFTIGNTIIVNEIKYRIEEISKKEGGCSSCDFEKINNMCIRNFINILTNTNSQLSPCNGRFYFKKI